MVLFCQIDVNGRTESDPASELLVRNILSYVSSWQPPARRGVRYYGDPAGRRYLESAGVELSGQGEMAAAFGLEEREARALAPRISMESREHIAAYFEPVGPGRRSPGISSADVHNRDPRNAPLVTGGATVVGDGNPGGVGGWARGVCSDGAWWQFDYSGGRMNVKRTFRNFARMTARLMGNLGAEMRTPLLARLSEPAGDGKGGG